MPLTFQHPNLPDRSHLSVKQVTEVLGLKSRQTVYNYVKAGKLCPMGLTKDRRHYKFTGKEVNRFWERQ